MITGVVAGYRAAQAALVRAAAGPWPAIPDVPDLAGNSPAQATCYAQWLRRVWAISEFEDVIEHASPALAEKVRRVCAEGGHGVRETRGAVLSVLRYLLRMNGRPTPFGLIAGVTTATFGAEPLLRWGTSHRIAARSGAGWLTEVAGRLERCPDLLKRLAVTANTTLMVRGGRLIVPYQAAPGGPGLTPTEISLKHTSPVRAAIEAARTPVIFEDLEAKIRAEFAPARPGAVRAMLTGLVEQGALITSLHAPGTEPDALAWLLRQLQDITAPSSGPAASIASSLTEIRALLESSSHAPSGGRRIREHAAARMRALAVTRQHPVAIDLCLDADITLPAVVAREAERAALVLTRLSACPAGTQAWREYHQRFYERYGSGSLVPLLDLVSDAGIGWPAGYPGAAAPARRPRLSRRDEKLLWLAQNAALDSQQEVVLDEKTVASLESDSVPLRLPPHLELGVRLHAATLDMLRRGDFRVEVTTVSRAAGVLTGRFLTVLEPQDAAALAVGLAGLPCCDQDTIAVQLSFPPLDPATAHVTRTPLIFPAMVSMAEHRAGGPDVVSPADLAVGCDGRRMYLVALGRGQRIEPVAMHALNLRKHTPPLARFVTELARAQCAQLTAFDWGAAATMPFLPRLRHGRIIVSPARWRIPAASLPARSAPWQQWDQALARWAARRQVPTLVHLTGADRYLPLDLDQPAHRVLLRAHLDTKRDAFLTEAPTSGQLGWCQDRPHEIIVPLTATRPAAWPRLPAPTRARVIGLDHGNFPGTSDVLLASLYGKISRQDAILTGYLPDLLRRLGEPATWWFVRYRDPDHDQHLRLRIVLPSTAVSGQATRTVSTWADELRHAGLLREIRYPADHPETGRWGSGAAWTAAREVFCSDSRAILAQLSAPATPGRQALTAANTAAIAAAFTGSTPAGMQWLTDHLPAAAPTRIPRAVLDEARQIADPRGGWAALRASPGGAALTGETWQARDTAIAAYRRHMNGPDTRGITADDVLSSLIHLSFTRSHGIDFREEARCMYLARAAAKAWTARTTNAPR